MFFGLKEIGTTSAQVFMSRLVFLWATLASFVFAVDCFFLGIQFV